MLYTLCFFFALAALKVPLKENPNKNRLKFKWEIVRFLPSSNTQNFTFLAYISFVVVSSVNSKLYVPHSAVVKRGQISIKYKPVINHRNKRSAVGIFRKGELILDCWNFWFSPTGSFLDCHTEIKRIVRQRACAVAWLERSISDICIEKFCCRFIGWLASHVNRCWKWSSSAR